MNKYRAIVAAPPGWFAVYEPREAGGPKMRAPVCAWVIVEDDDGDTFISGVDPTSPLWNGRVCEETPGLLAYEFIDPTHRREE